MEVNRIDNKQLQTLSTRLRSLSGDLENSGEGHLHNFPTIVRRKLEASSYYLHALHPSSLRAQVKTTPKRHWLAPIDPDILHDRFELALDGFAYFSKSAIETHDRMVSFFVRHRRHKTIHEQCKTQEWYQSLRLLRNAVVHGEVLHPLPPQLDSKFELSERSDSVTAQLKPTLPERLVDITGETRKRLGKKLSQRQMWARFRREGGEVPAHEKCHYLFGQVVHAIGQSVNDLSDTLSPD